MMKYERVMIVFPILIATSKIADSSFLDSTMSLNIITVTLNMDTVNFLGISIVGQSNRYGDGDCGIYVGSIMKGMQTHQESETLDREVESVF